jgi:hypothetical protein
MQVRNAVTYSRKSNTHQVCTKILRAMGTPLSDQLISWLDTGQYQNVVECKVDPRSYGDDHVLFARDYLASSLLRKYSSFPLGIDTAAVAMTKFMESEAACLRTNLSKVRPYENRSLLDYGISPE